MKYVYWENKNVSYGYLIICLFSLVILVSFTSHVHAADVLFIHENGNVGIGTNEPEAALDVKGKVRADELAGDGSALTVEGESIKLFLVPRGGIIAWFPGEQYREKRPDKTIKIKAPEGWAICDGTNNTPNLTDRFIRGPNENNSNIGENAGNDSHSHTGLVSESTVKGATIKYSGGSSRCADYSHLHKISPDTNLPRYFVLMYIMKL